MWQVGGDTVTVNPDGSTEVIKTQTAKADESFVSTYEPGSVLSTLKAKNSVLPVNDLQTAMKDPENHFVTVSGIELSLAGAIRLGYINVDGQGSVSQAAITELITRFKNRSDR